MRYILYVLLFVLAGTLCRQQFASLADSAFTHTESSVFTQLPQHSDQEAGQYRHLMVISEIIVASAANSGQKVASPHKFTSTHGTAVKHAVSQALLRRSAALAPHSVEYYVFSLGKIII